MGGPRHSRCRFAIRALVLVLVSLGALGAEGCPSDRDRAVERLEPGATPKAEQLTAAEFLDLPIPDETDVLLRFFEVDRAADCPNVDYAGRTSDLFGRVRNDTYDEPDDTPMSEILIRYCADG